MGIGCGSPSCIIPTKECRDVGATDGQTGDVAEMKVRLIDCLDVIVVDLDETIRDIGGSVQLNKDRHSIPLASLEAERPSIDTNAKVRVTDDVALRA